VRVYQVNSALYLPEACFIVKKDAQDAHEAIRPTSVAHPRFGRPFLASELALYKLIWQRFVASQMMPALLDQTTIDISAGPRYLFRATGSVIKFNGFLAVYEEGKDEKDADDEEQAEASGSKKASTCAKQLVPSSTSPNRRPLH
jgi:DNA topoisomerase-1